MDRKKVILLYSALALSSAAYLYLKRKRVRRYAVRPMNRDRARHGHFDNLVQFMKENDEEQFFKYTRLTPALFKHLLSLLEHQLQKCESKNPLSPEQRLIMTLHFLSEGCSMQQIAWDYYVGKTTVHCVVIETCDVIWELLNPIYMPCLKKPDWENVATGFFKKWNMPNCFGALDGKHITIQSPRNSGSTFFNYKKNFSIVLMAMCDAFYKFTLIDIGEAGSNHDSYIFSKSYFGNAILKNEIDIPDPKTLPQTDCLFPYFLVADQAFPLHVNIMRPYPGERLGEMRNIFNYRLSRARRCIENTFGILVQRWRILRKPIIANVDNCERFVKAAVVLHNFVQRSEMDIPLICRKYCPTGYADYVDVNGELHLGQWRDDVLKLPSVGRIGANNSSGIAKQMRENLAQYFVSDCGAVPWQWQHVQRGSLPE